MNALPSELLEAIIRYSLAPAVPHVEYRQRYDALINYSLVARRWRTLAQNEMFRHLWVQDATAQKLLDNSPLDRYVQNAKVQSIAFGRDRRGGTLSDARFVMHAMLRINNGVFDACLYSLELDYLDFYALESELAL
jgi:hypothetical protein